MLRATQVPHNGTILLLGAEGGIGSALSQLALPGGLTRLRHRLPGPGRPGLSEILCAWHGVISLAAAGGVERITHGH